MVRPTCICSLLVVLVVSTPALADVDRGLIIVTTEHIRSTSLKLDEFVAQKRARGFLVRVATENDFGGAGLKGQEKAMLIRSWLQDNHEGYSFLLLIGDAHSQYGDIPMLSVWPRHTYSDSECGGFTLDCRTVDTDTFYADLTGNWDLNENGRFGEHGLDDGPGGIDFEAELYVGRIPVFFNDVQDLDTILQHAMDYAGQSPEEIGYRRRVLLPAAFFYFSGQVMTTYSFGSNVDGAGMTEYFAHHYLDGRPDYSYTRLYEQGGVLHSQYDSELALTEENLVRQWSEGYGLVFWAGHGLEREVARTVWVSDDNDDGMTDNEEMAHPLFIHSTSARTIATAGRPAFVAAVSCEVGSAETPDNLTHSLLLSGAAVGMLGSSNVTPGSRMDWSDMQAPMLTQNVGGDNLGMLFLDVLMRGEYAAKAVADLKHTLGSDATIEVYAGKMMLNYFGDPTLTLDDTSIP